ncbi:archaellin/type IV pilin N-terminal domain-containing protein [Candidatus Alkanophaga liquidiphilum]
MTAFVVVAAVFSYVVLNAGFFTTQKSKEVVHTGVEQATSSIELTGDVVGYGWTYNSTAERYENTLGTNLTVVKFYLELTAGQNPMDMDGLVVSYTDKDTHVGNLTYNASATGTSMTGSTLGMKMSEWHYSIITTAGYGDNDNLLERGEKAEITVTLPGYGVTTDEQFIIEVKPASGATISITRSAPSSIDKVMNLH